MSIFWIITFIISLFLLVKGADWFVESAERIGLALKISPFIVGVSIVALGTSFPELAVSLTATLKGVTEIAASTALGSAIANIFLIVGFSAIVAGRLVVERSLIDLDAPLLATTTVLFVFIMADRKIIFFEGLLLLLAFIIYILYTVFRRKDEKKTCEMFDVLSSRVERRSKKSREEKGDSKVNFKILLFLVLGLIGLIIGARLNIKSLLKLSEIFGIATSFLTITAVAIGTSLPDMIVSVIAAVKKKYEISLGNVFGSNVFLVLAVVGVPALIRDLKVDELTFYVGLPFLVVATFLFVISGISRKIHIWEGLMYIILYLLFLSKLVSTI